MTKLSKCDGAVSHIIGTLLIVIIITILAALTASIVYGFLIDLNKPYIVNFTVHRLNQTTIEILNQGGPNLRDLKFSPPSPIIITVDNIDSPPISGNLNENVGSYSDYNANEGAKLKIIGIFTDNKRHILYDGII